jgi:hypothetical protein
MKSPQFITLSNEIPPYLTSWCNAVAKNTPDIMVDFYADNAILLGTFDENYEIGTQGIKEYFVYLFKNNVVTSVEITKNCTQFVNGEVMCSGTYIFKTKGGDVPARYSFLFCRNPHTQKWKIVNHHSSVPAKK